MLVIFIGQKYNALRCVTAFDSVWRHERYFEYTARCGNDEVGENSIIIVIILVCSFMCKIDPPIGIIDLIRSFRDPPYSRPNYANLIDFMSLMYIVMFYQVSGSFTSFSFYHRTLPVTDCLLPITDCRNRVS